MRVSDKIALIDRIGRILQERYRYDEIDKFFGHFGIDRPKDVGINSKWVYSKEALSGISDSLLLEIATELEIKTPDNRHQVIPPHNWKDTKLFKLFISHIAIEKHKAIRLKNCLSNYAISGFVAHEDIKPTKAWQVEIERALHTMDAFVSIHTEGFSESNWTQQEIGYALGTSTKIIALKMDEDPTGFISKNQALLRSRKTAEEIAKEIDEILSEDPRTSSQLEHAKQMNML